MGDQSVATKGQPLSLMRFAQRDAAAPRGSRDVKDVVQNIATAIGIRHSPSPKGRRRCGLCQDAVGLPAANTSSKSFLIQGTTCVRRRLLISVIGTPRLAHRYDHNPRCTSARTLRRVLFITFCDAVAVVQLGAVAIAQPRIAGKFDEASAARFTLIGRQAYFGAGGGAKKGGRIIDDLGPASRRWQYPVLPQFIDFCGDATNAYFARGLRSFCPECHPSARFRNGPRPARQSLSCSHNPA